MDEHSLPDEILDAEPNICELVTHAKTAEWNEL